MVVAIRLPPARFDRHEPTAKRWESWRHEHLIDPISGLFKARQHVEPFYENGSIEEGKHVERLKKLLLKILVPCGMDEARPTMRHLSLPLVN
jgi:hypothetical protein